jgi:hypothetical protein
MRRLPTRFSFLNIEMDVTKDYILIVDLDYPLLTKQKKKETTLPPSINALTQLNSRSSNSRDIIAHRLLDNFNVPIQ